MFNNASTIITRNFILKYVNEEDIFKRYLGIEPVTVGNFTNPLRQGDSNPGCGFYVDARGVWKFKDHAAGYNWDCFAVVQFAYGLTFKEALIRIAIDFGIIDGNLSEYVGVKTKERVKNNTSIRVRRRQWTKADYNYWARFNITPERLAFFNVTPISHAWLEREGILYMAYFHRDSDPGYCYHFGGYDYKLYFPLRAKGKFIHTNSDIVQGYSQLPSEGSNFLFTKSYKDVMAIDSVGNEFDLNSVAPMSETIVVAKTVFVDIYNRFDNIGTLFDLDRTGVQLTKKYQKEYGIDKSYFFGKAYRGCTFGKPIIKDFADHIAVKGVDETKRLLDKILNNGRQSQEVPF